MTCTITVLLVASTDLPRQALTPSNALVRSVGHGTTSSDRYCPPPTSPSWRHDECVEGSGAARFADVDGRAEDETSQ